MFKFVFSLAIWILTLNGCVLSTNCPDTWIAFRGSCYLFVENKPMEFYNAVQYCGQHDAYIVRAETPTENLFLKQHMKSTFSKNRWLGLTDEKLESIWRWYGENIETTYTDWAVGQPDDFNGTEDCAAIGKAFLYQWNDFPCTGYFLEPICEKRYQIHVCGLS